MAQALCNHKLGNSIIPIPIPIQKTSATTKNGCYLHVYPRSPLFGWLVKGIRNNKGITKSMKGERRENVEFLQRPGLNKRQASGIPIGVWERFPARTVQQMMDRMAGHPNDGSGYAKGRTAWDIKEGDSAYKLRFDMPGMTKNDVKVWVEEKMLVIKAQKQNDQEDWPANTYGTYTTRIALPENVEFDKIKAEGDPTRALGESISFGRYTSETLAWEKWSTFTQNRYIEEAQKYSKPGSVAKMKAYFEAHYGRFGAKKCVQQQQQQQQKPPPDASSRVDVDNDHNTTILSSSVVFNPEPVPAVDTHTSIQESPTTDHPAVHLLYDSSAQLKDEKTEAASYVESLVVAADARLTDSSTVNNVQGERENDVVSATPERNATLKEKPEKGKMDTMTELKLADYSGKRLKKSNLSKLSSSLSRLATPVRCKMEGNATPYRKVSQLSSSLARIATPVRQPRKEGHVTPINRLFVKDTLHMLPNVSSDVNKMKKPSPASSKAGIGKIFTPLGKIIRDSFASSTSTPSRASVNSVSRHPSATPQSEARRSRVALEKAFDRSRRLDQQLKCPSTGNVKSSTQSPATFASFSFRTEERAAKRREKRLEKEAENLSFTDNTKAKPTPNSRKSFQSRNLKPSTVVTVRTEVLSENLKKIPPSQQSQKCEARTASDLSRSKSFHPPQRAAGSKKFSENSKALPSTLTMKKKRRENTSPNIL